MELFSNGIGKGTRIKSSQERNKSVFTEQKGCGGFSLHEVQISSSYHKLPSLRGHCVCIHRVNWTFAYKSSL